MPAIKVFEFAQRIKDYVRIGLNHTNWIVDSILVFYSTRSKQTKFGYKVVPLYVGVVAYDTAENRTTNCRIQFDDLCTIVAPSTGHSIPYISVSTGAKDNRAIFDTGITYLKIDCTKTGTYNGYPCIKHFTVRADNKPHFDKLNETVIGKIKERLEIYNTDRMHKMELQFQELIDEDETTGAVNPLRHC